MVFLVIRGSPLTFSGKPRDNVIMVRESLLSNTSPPCDERMLCEHVKHHAPEHLSVSFSNTTSTPLIQDEGGEGQNRGEGLLFTKRNKRGNPRPPKGSQHTLRLQLALIALLICRNGGLIKEPSSVCGSHGGARLSVIKPGWVAAVTVGTACGVLAPAVSCYWVTGASPRRCALQTGGGLLVSESSVTSLLHPPLSPRPLQLCPLISGKKKQKKLG